MHRSLLDKGPSGFRRPFVFWYHARSYDSGCLKKAEWGLSGHEKGLRGDFFPARCRTRPNRPVDGSKQHQQFGSVSTTKTILRTTVFRLCQEQLQRAGFGVPL
jgi:hypothetical protein